MTSCKSYIKSNLLSLFNFLTLLTKFKVLPSLLLKSTPKNLILLSKSNKVLKFLLDRIVTLTFGYLLYNAKGLALLKSHHQEMKIQLLKYSIGRGIFIQSGSDFHHCTFSSDGIV